MAYKNPPRRTSRNPGNFITPDEFWTLVDKSGGPDACWPWLGPRFAVREGMCPADYGKLVRAKDGVMLTISAHRVAFEFTNGYAPKVTRHTCDNPPCCNPAHLEDGSHGDNMRDKVARLRLRNGQNRLSLADVESIRLRFQPRTQRGSNLKDLAREYNVSQQTIYRVACTDQLSNLVRLEIEARGTPIVPPVRPIRFTPES